LGPDCLTWSGRIRGAGIFSKNPVLRGDFSIKFPLRRTQRDGDGEIASAIFEGGWGVRQGYAQLGLTSHSLREPGAEF
jgi:hypothetical protein